MSSNGWDRRHLLGLEGLSAADLEWLLETAAGYVPVAQCEAPALTDLSGRIIANIFLEDSTRTRMSFAVAAHRLGAQVVTLAGKGSSVSKGESFSATIRNIAAMGVDGIVVRTDQSGALHHVAGRMSCPLINGGDGRHEHPTQGLLDILTMRQRLGDRLEGKTIGIVGDIGHSRVARSNIHGVTTLGANVLLVGPPTLVPKSFESIARGPGTVRVTHDLDEALDELDVIMMLRVQLERGAGVTRDYPQLYGLNRRRVERLRPEVPVMHPGPINHGIELTEDVADDYDRSVILRQVGNGVAVRMAVLKLLVGG